ncbi:MAG TPA: type I glyceraldehyde-3-phosphate dehydrogenase [Candidatus Heimdallarchaeota archaeon]|nr:type I glyceraldehyde-3-phosphate dehydrogenase [Candidatus Heimdallarchaeota archaeon]
MKKVAINGFGRIGRAFFRLAFGEPDIEIVAINDPFIALDEARYLLSRDSVYGRFARTVSTDDKGITVDGSHIPLIGEKDPTKLPWGDMEIDVVIESTGIFRAHDGPKGAAQHLTAGAKRVLLSVPPKGEGAEKIPQIVYGVNHKDVESSEMRIVSAASCTTNSLVPVAYVLEKEFGIVHGFLSTVHGYTADQRLVDASHKDYARGRAAAINIVPTTTGAAKATAKVIPSLAGKMDGMAFRVPVVTGSVTDFTVEMKREVTVDEVNATLRRYADGEFAGVLGVSEDPMVSTDIIGDPRASVVDLSSTRVVDQRLLKVVTFYDNEWGYTNQLLRVANLL